MRLRKILKYLNVKEEYDDIKLEGFTRDISQIKEGYLYFSFKKITLNEYILIKQKGAHFIIGETPFLKHDYLEVGSIKKAYQTVLYELNKHKLKNKILIGITGTNGKTSVSTLIYNYLKNNAIYYGSSGIYKDKLYKSNNTTPSMEEFFKYLGDEKYIIVELSSISLYEYRMFNIEFDYLVLTNIYEDHLDYHETEKDYYYAKLLILATNFNAIALISDKITDKNILRLNRNSYYYGLKSNFFNIRQSIENLYINDNNEEIKLNPKLKGEYNLYNILAAIELLYLLGFSLKRLEPYFNSNLEVKGRNKIINYLDKQIIIDYPHTASAYHALLSSLVLNKEEALVIFGAGGNRQKSKRYDYAKIVSLFSGYAIVTNDNPREEDEMEIAQDITTNLEIPYEIILNRKDAIIKGINSNYKQIFILGKGEEDYILVNGDKIHHNDLEVVLDYIHA